MLRSATIILLLFPAALFSAVTTATPQCTGDHDSPVSGAAVAEIRHVSPAVVEISGAGHAAAPALVPRVEPDAGPTCAGRNILPGSAVGGVIRMDFEQYRQIARAQPAIAQMLSLFLYPGNSQSDAIDMLSQTGLIRGHPSYERALAAWHGVDRGGTEAHALTGPVATMWVVRGTGRLLGGDLWSLRRARPAHCTRGSMSSASPSTFWSRRAPIRSSRRTALSR